MRLKVGEWGSILWFAVLGGGYFGIGFLCQDLRIKFVVDNRVPHDPDSVLGLPKSLGICKLQSFSHLWCPKSNRKSISYSYTYNNIEDIGAVNHTKLLSL